MAPKFCLSSRALPVRAKELSMIQLANDPNASRMNRHPAQNDGKGVPLSAQRSRSGHAWPFLSRYTARPVPQNHQNPTASDSGS
jgi:hypothetical protein